MATKWTRLRTPHPRRGAGAGGGCKSARAARARAREHALAYTLTLSRAWMGRSGIHAVTNALVSSGAMRKSECQFVAPNPGRLTNAQSWYRRSRGAPSNAAAVAARRGLRTSAATAGHSLRARACGGHRVAVRVLHQPPLPHCKTALYATGPRRCRSKSGRKSTVPEQPPPTPQTPTPQAALE